MTDSELHQAQVARLFDTLVEGYDRAALRFFPFAADRLAQRLTPRSGEKILDIATGTGAVAVAVAQRLNGGGRVMAVDISERMLDRAYANVRRMALHNIDIHPMDAMALEFRNDYFDAVTCSFGLFFMPDMLAALREWRRVLRPGGRMLITVFGTDAFQPLADAFCAQLHDCGGGELRAEEFAWRRVATAEQVSELLTAAGFEGINCESDQFGYHLQSPQEWWEIIWNTGFRAYLQGLDAAALARFEAAHLAEIGRGFKDGTCWLNVPVLFVSADSGK